MTYQLGHASRANLLGVHPELIKVVESAILRSDQDFTVNDGLRSMAEQRALVARGTSWTITSRHLRQADGFAHAVDLVPIIDGRKVWDWPGCYRIAFAMAAAARVAHVALRWGGVWDRPLAAFADSVVSIKAASENYVARRRAQKKRAAIDGPHFELLTIQSRGASG